MADQVLTFDGPTNTVLELRTTNQENVALVAKPPGALVAPPLSSVFVVDRSAPAGGNGSIGVPFNSLQQGVDAVAATGHAGTVDVAPGDYTLDPIVTIPDGVTLSIVGMTAATTTLPQIDWGSAANDLSLQNVQARLIGTDPLIVRASDCIIDFGAGQVAGRFSNCQLFGTSVATIDCHDCEIVGGLATSVSAPGSILQFASCTFSGAGTLDGAILWDRASEVNAAQSGKKITQPPTSTDGIAERLYGTGDSGTLLLSGGTVTDGTTEYSNVVVTNGTFGGAGTGGRQWLWVRDLLDISNVGVGAGIVDETGPANGNNAVGSAGGVGAGGPAGLFDQGGGRLDTANGQAGVAGNGGVPSAGGFRSVPGGRGGGCGAGGNSGANTGGATSAQGGQSQVPLTHMHRLIMAGPSANAGAPEVTIGGTNGRGGASGAGDGTNTGGGGGAGGGAGGMIVIFARCIKVSPSGTLANVIQSRAAGKGGNGGNAAAGNAAGGGGAGGGGGGCIVIFYEWIIGTQPAGPFIRADGGNGGNGGNAVGTGTGGTGGAGGTGGVIQQFNTLTNKRSRTVGTAGAAGTGPTGTLGGAGGNGGTCSANLLV